MTKLSAFLTILGLSILCTSSAVFSDDALVQSFNQAYQAYNEFEQQGDLENSLPQAKTALELGEKILIANDEELAILTYNYASNLLQLNQYAEAEPVLRKSLQRYEIFYGKDSPELIPVLIDLGQVEFKVDQRKSVPKQYKRALKLSKKEYGEDSVEYGWHLTQAGSTILNNALRKGRGEKYVSQGYQILQSKLGNKHVRTGYAAFQLAKYDMRRNRLPKARDHLLLALESFENPAEPSNQLEMSTHAFLVKVFEEMGQSDNATQHCLAIGRMTPSGPEQDLMQLFITAPNYPYEAARSGSSGRVKLSFDVDEFGIVREPNVIELTGDPRFGPASIEALSKWRFAPKFEDGKAVVSHHTQVMTFELSN